MAEKKMTKEKWIFLAIVIVAIVGIICFISFAPFWVSLTTVVAFALGLAGGYFGSKWYFKKHPEKIKA